MISALKNFAHIQATVAVKTAPTSELIKNGAALCVLKKHAIEVMIKLIILENKRAPIANIDKTLLP